MSNIPTQSGGAWNEMTGKNSRACFNFEIYSKTPFSLEDESDDGSRIRK